MIEINDDILNRLPTSCVLNKPITELFKQAVHPVSINEINTIVWKIGLEALKEENEK